MEKDPVGAVAVLVAEDMMSKWKVFRSRKDTKGQTHDYKIRENPHVKSLLTSSPSITVYQVIEKVKSLIPDFQLSMQPDGNGCVEYILRTEIPPALKAHCIPREGSNAIQYATQAAEHNYQPA